MTYKTPKLPNLWLRSIVTFFSLYALLGLLVISAVEILKVSYMAGLTLYVGLAGLQFIVSPWIIDVTLRWLYKAKWVAQSDLPEHIQLFVQQVCESKGIPFPKFCIIDDQTPQAFTYGRTPRSARLVYSKGLESLLSEDELEAVIAHEMGHICHWDMALMTVMQIVPMISYAIYKALTKTKKRKSSSSKRKDYSFIIAVFAYVVYIASQYVVLWFSRTREYHADRFSALITNSPISLYHALIKIAYGYTHASANGQTNKAINAMNIFDASHAMSVDDKEKDDDQFQALIHSADNIGAMMQWDLYNPWATWQEFHSTHPLIAKRLKHLSDLAVSLEQGPLLTVPSKPEHGYGFKLLMDVFMIYIPWFALVAAGMFGILYLEDINLGLAHNEMLTLIGICTTLASVLFYARTNFIYPKTQFDDYSIQDLLKTFDVSHIRPIPCRIEGKVIGKADAGYVFSEHLTLKDDKGIMSLIYCQPLWIMQKIFAVFKANKFVGENVVITGWYHRANRPYLKVNTIESAELNSKSYVPFVCKLFYASLLIAGLGMLFMSIF